MVGTIVLRTGQELCSLSQGARHGGWKTWLSLHGMICTSSPVFRSSLHSHKPPSSSLCHHSTRKVAGRNPHGGSPDVPWLPALVVLDTIAGSMHAPVLSSAKDTFNDLLRMQLMCSTQLQICSCDVLLKLQHIEKAIGRKKDEAMAGPLTCKRCTARLARPAASAALRRVSLW